MLAGIIKKRPLIINCHLRLPKFVTTAFVPVDHAVDNSLVIKDVNFSIYTAN